MSEWFKERGREIIFRSKVEMREKQEKFLYFFFKKLCNGKKVMKVLKNERGNEVLGEGMMKVVRDYCEKLYCKKECDIGCEYDFFGGD